MNSTVRKDFLKISGFDPIELFNPAKANYWKINSKKWTQFAEYRTDLCNHLKLNFVTLIQGIKKTKPDFDIMMTIMDTTEVPGLAENIAEDPAESIYLNKQFGITLQIEDPEIMWSGKPERYAKIGEFYRKLIPDRDSLVLDCNVLDNHIHGNGGLPTEKPTGEELRQIVYNMDLSQARLAFYSEGSINKMDFQNLNEVLARNVVITPENDFKWRIQTPNKVTLRVNKQDLLPRLDGEVWLAGVGDEVIVPAGDHILQFEAEAKYFNLKGLKTQLQYISGELKWANFLNNSLEFAYNEEKGPCYVVISKKPGNIIIDDKKTSCSILENGALYSIKLPGGHHVVKIDVGGGASILVESSGVVLLSLIIIFGFVTSVLFLGLFLVIKIKRKLKL